MSAIEKALRQIDGRAGGTNPFADQGRSGTAMPLPPPPSSGLRWTLSVLALSGAAGLAWYATTHWPIVASPTPLKPASVSPVPVSPAPVASAAPVAAAAPAAEPAAMAPAADPAALTGAAEASGPPQWLAMGGQAWIGGLRNEAALLWMTGLRNLSPTTIALRVGRQQTLQQAEALYARWAGQLPLVVLREYGAEPARWTVLALPAPVGLDQAHAALRQAHGEAVQWGTVAHWISALTSEPGQEPWPASPAAAGGAPVSSAPAQPSPPPARAVPADAAARPTVVSAPPARVAPAPLPRPVVAMPPPAAPAPAPAPAPVPELSQSQQAVLDETRAAPVAARAIEADYERVEQQLARGEHETALEGVLKLERGIGANWRTRYLAGVAYSGLGRWEEARDALGSAQLKNSGHARIPLYLSVAQQERGDHTAALDTLNKALANHPSMAELWLNKGHSLQAMGRSEEGNAAYARFMEFSAHRSDLQAQRAWVHNRIARLK